MNQQKKEKCIWLHSDGNHSNGFATFSSQWNYSRKLKGEGRYKIPHSGALAIFLSYWLVMFQLLSQEQAPQNACMNQ